MATKKTKKTAKSSKVLHSAIELAEQLIEVRTRMALDKTLNDALTRDFKAALKREGIKRAGNYHIVKADNFQVAVEELALPFALQRNLVKVDTSKVKEVFRLDEKLRFVNPAEFGFKVVTQEKVNPVRGQDEDE